MSDFSDFIRRLPKAELHLHIEGTLEPEMLMRLAKKHNTDLPYETVADVKKAYDFEDLQSFLDLYYLGASVLVDEEDFFTLMYAYLTRCHEQGIVHTEMMFDPQTHTERGIDFSVFMSGFQRARQKAEAQWGISSCLIMCFLRHLSEASALATLDRASPYRDQILAVGLDSAEVGHPPEKFEKAFQKAAEEGYQLVAHAGEEGPPSYIWGALEILKVSRIDHGVRCLEDDTLLEKLAKEQTPLTVCPLSNVRLCVFERMEQHPILTMLGKGLNVCVNSDDPPYFGGYLIENFNALHASLGLSVDQARQLACNSIAGSFLDDDRKQVLLAQIAVAA